MASTSMQEVVRQAKNDKKHELIISGQSIAVEIEEDGLDEELFTIQTLNFLEISKCGLKTLDGKLGKLKNLTNLVVHSNNLSTLPDCLGELAKLKLLDVSGNSLVELPATLNQLSLLQTLDVSKNALEFLPQHMDGLKNLSYLDISQNNFKIFPMALCDVTSLMQVRASKNEISDVPPEIDNLSSLKFLDLTNNNIKVLPGELGNCVRLKQDLLMTGNPVSDKRLEKLFTQGKSKAAIEYIRKNCPKLRKAGNVESGKDATEKMRKKKTKDAVASDEDKYLNTVSVLHCHDETVHVTMSSAAHDIRPFIICCIIKNVNLAEENTFKRFIAIQVWH